MMRSRGAPKRGDRDMAFHKMLTAENDQSVDVVEGKSANSYAARS